MKSILQRIGWTILLWSSSFAGVWLIAITLRVYAEAFKHGWNLLPLSPLW